MTNQTQLHITCTSQLHKCFSVSDEQIKSVSNSLSASANYLRKLVEGEKKSSANPESDEKKNKAKKTEHTTVTVHADASYKDILVGFTSYDAKEPDTPSYLSRRRIFDEVRSKYPNLDDLLRDEKVQALKELKNASFDYYTIQVTAFVERDGLTKAVCSKSHHRLEKPNKEYLESILKTIFKGTIRPETSTSGPKVDNAGDGSPNVSKVTP